MSITSGIRGSGELSHERISLVHQHLQEIMESPAFAGSKRAQDFLGLIVDHALRGEVESLRERMIGAEMFGRPVAYDTANDSIVRVKASEVRRKLAQFYAECNKKSVVRIELPIGSYVPRFRFRSLTPSALSRSESGPIPEQEQAPFPDKRTFEEEQHAASRFSWKTLRSQPFILAGLALGVGLCALAGYWALDRSRGDSNSQSSIRSIAVLPLENLSGDQAQDYFADGVTEELIADLGQVSALRVISRTSAMSYKGSKKSLPEIARELKVEGVVEGSVLREGEQIRITARLIDVRTDRPIWSRSYVRDITSVLTLQGEVAQAIADEVSINVTPQEQARLAHLRSMEPFAQDMYLQGKLRLNSGDINGAIDFFQKAIKADPNAAQAYAALADCYGWMGESGRLGYLEAFSRQKDAAARAVELDDSLPEGHLELADAAMDLNWDWATAAKEFNRARELNSNSVLVHDKFAIYLLRTGKLSDAIAETNRALELDPVSGRAFRNAGFVNYFSRQYDQALALLNGVHSESVQVPEDTFLWGDIYAEKHMYPQSIVEFLKDGDSPHALGHLGNAYARAGQPDAALRTIALLEGHVRADGVGAYEIALVYAGLNQKNKAFDWLEQAYQTHDEGLTNLMIDPCLDPLRSDPRFAGLERRVGLIQ
jgi:TolB-like protein